MDVYIGGERREKGLIPKHYEYFFSAKLMLLVLATLAAMALLAGIP